MHVNVRSVGGSGAGRVGGGFVYGTVCLWCGIHVVKNKWGSLFTAFCFFSSLFLVNGRYQVLRYVGLDSATGSWESFLSSHVARWGVLITSHQEYISAETWPQLLKRCLRRCLHRINACSGYHPTTATRQAIFSREASRAFSTA